MKLISVLFLTAFLAFGTVARDSDHYSDAVSIDGALSSEYQSDEYEVSIRTTIDGHTNCYITWTNEYFDRDDDAETILDYERLITSIYFAAAVLERTSWDSNNILIGFLNEGFICTFASGRWLKANLSEMNSYELGQWYQENVEEHPVSSIYNIIGQFTESNGIITDSETNLQWRVGPDSDTNYYDANSWVDGLGGSWRMPSRDELTALYDAGIEYRIWGCFQNGGRDVWSNLATDSPQFVWYFKFDTGRVDYGMISTGDHRRAFAVRSQ